MDHGSVKLCVFKYVQCCLVLIKNPNICRSIIKAFKVLIKEKVKSSALKYLQNLQQTHSKSKTLIYTKLDLQEYLKADSLMTRKEKSFTFQARSRMLDLRCNFKSVHNVLKCRLCDSHEENQQGLLSCQALWEQSDKSKANYSDLLSQDKNKIRDTALILKMKYEKFQHLQVHGQTKDKSHSQPSAASSDNLNAVNDNIVNVYDDDEDMD